jgi:asparagine synthase (glutamine-hydrolysing)
VGGIAGIVHYRGDPPAREQAQQLSAGVAHRGPDDKGLFLEPPFVGVQRVFATHTRHNTTPRLTKDLVVLLDGPADLDTLSSGWTEQGAACLGSLKGGFAAAIWSRSQQVLWLISDPAGTRPLFYAQHSGRVAFASTAKALLGLNWVSREVATDALAEYLSFRYVHAPRTLHRDISAVPPGHLVRIDSAGARTERWWAPQWAPAGAPSLPADELGDRFDATLRRSVDRRLQTSAPTGVLLSGGLDSTAILYHALQLGHSPTAYTSTLAGDPADESPFASRVASLLGAKHELVRIEDADIIAGIDTATEHMGAPLPTPAAIVQHVLMSRIRLDTKVVLAGDGGDEVLAGRSMASIARRLRRARTVGRLPGPAKHLSRRAARRGGFKDLSTPPEDFGLSRKIGGSRVFDAQERVALLRDPGMARPGIRRTLLEPIYQEVRTDPLNAILHVWQRGFLAQDALARSDRMSAHCGVQMRFPFLDSELLALTCSMPGPDKLSPSGLGFLGKAPLRLAMKDRLPTRLLNRPKRAMPAPLGLWLRGPGAGLVRERIDRLCESELFVARTLRTLSRAHLEGKEDHAMQLWTLLLLDAWLAP